MSQSRIHSTQRWRKLAARTIKEEPLCRHQLPGCTRISTCADHIIPISIRPDLAYERTNTTGSCARCNNRRGNTPYDQLDQLRANLLATQQHSSTKPIAPQHDSAPALGFFVATPGGVKTSNQT